jgi:hypothetical protein
VPLRPRAGAARIGSAARDWLVQWQGTALGTVRCWESHCQQISTIRSIFLYLDRTFVIQSAAVRSLWDMGLQVGLVWSGLPPPRQRTRTLPALPARPALARRCRSLPRSLTLKRRAHCPLARLDKDRSAHGPVSQQLAANARTDSSRFPYGPPVCCCAAAMPKESGYRARCSPQHGALRCPIATCACECSLALAA